MDKIEEQLDFLYKLKREITNRLVEINKEKDLLDDKFHDVLDDIAYFERKFAKSNAIV